MLSVQYLKGAALITNNIYCLSCWYYITAGTTYCFQLEVAFQFFFSSWIAISLFWRGGDNFCPLFYSHIFVFYCTWHGLPKSFLDKHGQQKQEPHPDGLLPSEEFQLTANSLGAHIETHGKFILRTLSSQWTHKMTHTVSLLWAIGEITNELTMQW